jgi:hypothetical protein
MIKNQIKGQEYLFGLSIYIRKRIKKYSTFRTPLFRDLK